MTAMKKTLSVLLSLLLSASLLSPVCAEDFIPNCVDLYFPSNPTTGYTWTAEAEDDGIVEVREQFFEDSSSLGLAGAGGTHWFHFDGLKEGITSVVLRYARSWESVAPVYSFTCRISVDEQKNVLIWGIEMSDGSSVPEPSEDAGGKSPANEEEDDWDPDISFVTADTEGKEWTSRVFSEAKLTMLNLWEYWCPPCVAELPDLQLLSEDYRDRGLQIFGVSAAEDEQENIAVMEELNITYPTLRLTPSINLAMNTGYVPATVFVDQQGHIVSEVYVGSRSYDQWAKIIETLLAE